MKVQALAAAVRNGLPLGVRRCAGSAISAVNLVWELLATQPGGHRAAPAGGSFVRSPCPMEMTGQKREANEEEWPAGQDRNQETDRSKTEEEEAAGNAN